MYMDFKCDQCDMAEPHIHVGPEGGLVDSGSSVAVDLWGRIVVAGRSYNLANDDMVIWRIIP